MQRMTQVTLPSAVKWAHVVAPQQQAQVDALPSVCLPAAADQTALVRRMTQLVLQNASQWTALLIVAPQQWVEVDALPSTGPLAAEDQSASVRNTTQLTLPSTVWWTVLHAVAPQQRASVDMLLRGAQSTASPAFTPHLGTQADTMPNVLAAWD